VIPGMTVAALAQAIGFAFALGGLLLGFLTLLPRTRSIARQLWPVLASEAVILAVGVLPWLLPPHLLFAVLLVASARIGFESGSVHGRVAGRDLSAAYAVLLVSVCAASWFTATLPLLYVAFALFFLALATIWTTDDSSVANSLARLVVFPLLPLAAFSHAAGNLQLAPLMVLAFFLVEVFDSFSLLGGRLYGRTPLVPRLSPRKTWEGLATGAGTVLIAVASLIAWLDVPALPMILVGIVVVAAAIVGDLLGSQAKRRAGVKDYPAVMKVQGGLLDIVDAWLVAGPCVASMAVSLGYSQ